MTGFESWDNFKILKFAEYQAMTLWELERGYEDGGSDHKVRIGGEGRERNLVTAVQYLEEYFKLLVAYADLGPRGAAEHCDVTYLRRRLEGPIQNMYNMFVAEAVGQY